VPCQLNEEFMLIRERTMLKLPKANACMIASLVPGLAHLKVAWSRRITYLEETPSAFQERCTTI
jgi:hypothetical protein